MPELSSVQEPSEGGRARRQALIPREHGAYVEIVFPLVTAGDVAPGIAFTAGAVWAGIFLLETLTVRGVRASGKENINADRSFLASSVAGGMGILAAIAITMAGAMPLLAGAAIVPAALVALICALARVHARHLRTLGWSLVASNIVALAALLIVFR